MKLHGREVKNGWMVAAFMALLVAHLAIVWFLAR
jgi:hypothetical protein